MDNDRKKILLVDDESIIALSQSETLKKAGYDVVIAMNGDSAINAVREDAEIDLILMDIDLGRGMDGTMAAEVILLNRDIPIVFLSSHTEPEIVDKTEKITSYGYVVKNSGDTVLLASIRMAFRLRDAYEKLRRREERVEEALKMHQQAEMRIQQQKSELEAANEELQATIEELQATNEEFEAVNEELARSQREIIKSEEKYRSLFDNMISGVVIQEAITDEKGNIVDFIYTDANNAVERQSRLKKEQFIGKRISEVYADLGRTDFDWVGNLMKVATTGETLRFEYHVSRFDYWFDVVEYRNQPGSVVSIFEDITERKVADRLLRRSQEKYSNIFRFSPSAITVSDFETGLIVEANEGVRWTGWSPEEITGKTSAEIGSWIRDEDRGDIIREVLASGRIINRPVKFIKRDGTIAHAIMNASIIEIEGKKHLLAITYDATAENEAVEQVRSLNDELRITIEKLQEKNEEFEKINRELARSRRDIMESENMFRSLIDTAPIPMIISSDFGKTNLILNRKFTELFGYTIEDVPDIGHWWPLAYPDEKYRSEVVDLWEEKVSLAVRNTLPMEPVETRVTCKDGLVRNIIFTLSSVGQTYAIFMNDVTEFRQARESMKKSREDFDKFFSMTLDLLCIADTDGYFRKLNPQWEKTLGYGIKDLEGKKFLDFIHPEDMSSTLQAVAQLSEQKEVIDFTNRYQARDGSYRWIEWRSYPEGKLIYAAARDVTDRKLAEDELAKREALLNAILENAGVGILMVDRTMKIVKANRKMSDILGFEPVELLEKTFTEITYPEDVSESLRMFHSLEEGEIPSYEIEKRYVRKNGSPVWCSVSVTPIRDLEGFPIVIMGVIVDITEKKIATEKINRALAEKEMLFRELQHRIKNSMAIITGLIGLEAKRVSDPAVRDLLQNIRNRVSSLVSLYDLLYRAGDATTIRLDEYLGRMARSLLSSYASVQARISLVMQIEAIPFDVKSAISVGLIVNELLTNSLKYAFPEQRSGEIRLSLTRTGKSAVFEVSDNGIGLPDGFDIDRPGGLGIEIVRMLSLQIGGRVEMLREAGAAFRITFPVEK